jgi:thioredoxin 1
MTLSGAALLLACPGAWALEPSAPTAQLPVAGMVTMVDVGAAKCIPCKAMAPILEDLAKEYQGRAVIAFVDVRKHPEMNERFRVSGIPTQIFYDRQGHEVERHLGFLDREGIVKRLKQLDVN